MTEIFTAKTVEEAKALAAKKFGKSVSEIKFEIIDEGKKGFLGIGKSDAKVKATYNDGQKKTASEKPAAPAKPAEPKKTESAAAAPVKEEKKPESAEAPKKDKPAAEAPANNEKKSETAEEQKKESAPEVKPVQVEAPNVSTEAEKPSHNDEEDYSLDNFTLIEDESLIHPKVKVAMDYITSILKAMDINVTFTVYQNETGSILNIDSDYNGSVIGRRGETLDAIQYLCSIISNKGDKDYYRITIDCLGYRQKRKETLEQLAAKVAKTVLRTGRSQPLEPMNPYERRVIHSAIANIEGVSSRSVGEEPYRKIIISSNNPRNNGKRRDSRRDGGKGDRRNRPKNHERDNFERKSVDVSTSFEKDYKRPKPEDSIEGGLYGKIEL